MSTEKRSFEPQLSKNICVEYELSISNASDVSVMSFSMRSSSSADETKNGQSKNSLAHCSLLKKCVYLNQSVL